MRSRPTMYRGILMRSRLEAAYAQVLDQRVHDLKDQCDWANFSWEYEPQCFADETGVYLPDFVLKFGEERTYYEVKPEPFLSDLPALDAVLERMEIIWSSEPRAELLVMVGVGYPTRFVTGARAHSASTGWYPDMLRARGL